MKNKKIMLVFIAMIIFVMAIMPIVKASDNNPFNILNEDDTNNTQNATNDEKPAANNEKPTINDEPNTENTNVAENKLPQTGVAEDTTLFVFIGICLVSAIYAYTKIKNYKNI
ncbi:unknown [Clostridium sp. CAG:508]|jgi:LPXTG-motif cell wall anchor domain protein|nr:LPXTG cell wall anchor domain-containing protein [Clostridia bacterium]CDC31604.1 unknown [Clostridium sp. CAG:508]